MDEWVLPDPARQRGRTFVYVLPSLGEDLTKVGFTQDPVQRFRTFHPRFFALFDLEQGMLVETVTAATSVSSRSRDVVISAPER